MLISDQDAEDITKKGVAIYNERLRNILEPEHDNEYVVIHVDTGDYAVARRRWDAAKEMHDRHGVDGLLLTMRIGPESEYSLISRMLTSEAVKSL